MKVQDVMTRDVQCCSPGSKLVEAAMLMWHHDCGVIPVVDHDGRVVGMITDRDICMALARRHQTAWDIPTALGTMQAHRVRRLPVVDEEGRLSGLLSMTDIVLHTKEAMRSAPPAYTAEDVMAAFDAFCGRRPLVGI